jgi:hypothetical protein
MSALTSFRGVPQAVWQVLYVLPVSAPLVVTADRRFTVFSVLLVAAAAVSHVFFWSAYTSVWRFFAEALLIFSRPTA